MVSYIGSEAGVTLHQAEIAKVLAIPGPLLGFPSAVVIAVVQKCVEEGLGDILLLRTKVIH